MRNKGSKLKLAAMLVGVSLSSLLLSPLTVSAGEIAGKATDVRVDASGMGYIRFDRQVTNLASCGVSHLNHMSFNTNTVGGRGMLAMALAAHATGKTITAVGTGSCEGYTVVEAILNLYVNAN